MMKHRFSRLIIFTVLLAAVAGAPLKEVSTEEPDPIDAAGITDLLAKVNGTYARGDSWAVSSLDEGYYGWSSAPTWISDGSSYVPYIFQDNYTSDGFYQVQSGLIGTKIYDYYAVFYSPDMAEVRLYDERWEVQRWTGSKWSDMGAQSGSPTFSISQDETGVNVTKSFISWAGNLTIIYTFREGRSLKHTVFFNSSIAEETEFRVLQKWAGIVGTKVKHEDGVTNITSSTVVNGSQFEFLKADGNLSIFEDQWDMYYGYNETTASYYVLENEKLQPVEIDVHAQGMKVDFVFGTWMLDQGESLVIDPTTSTYEVASGVSGYGYRNGVGQTWDALHDGIQTGYSKDYLYAPLIETDATAYQKLSRSVTWYATSSIPDTASIIDAKLSLYGNAKSNGAGVSAPALNVYAGFPSGYYASHGTVQLSTSITYDNFDISGWNNFTLNEAGRAIISKTASTKFAFREAVYDAPDVDPAVGGTSSSMYMRCDSATGVNPPILEVTYVNVPTITSASITGRDDTDNVYAVKEYDWVAVVNHGDGATAIDEVWLRAKSGGGTIWEVKVITLTATPAWSIVSGDTIIDLNTGTSTWGEAGEVGTATFKITTEWDHTQYDDMEIAVYVKDSGANTAGWTDMQTDYVDIISRLVVSNLAASDSRHNVDGTVTFSGSVNFATTTSGSTASSVYPADAQFTSVDIHDASHVEKASDSSIVNGAFSTTSATLPSSVTSTTYHVWLDLVADYTDIDSPDGDTVAVISDRVHATATSVSDTRANIGVTVTVDWTLKYDYDEELMTDGTVTIEGVAASHIGSGVWRVSPNRGSVAIVWYNEFTVTGNAYGITVEDANGQSDSVIWDRINFKTATLETTDAHINSDATGEWYAELLYEYDNAEVTDGSVTLNTGSMSWDGGEGRWEYTNAPAAVADVARNIASVSGNVYGITSLNSAVTSDSETIEFDEVVFQTGTFSVTDGRINYNANGEWYVKLMLDNNDEAISSGTITLNTGAMSYDGGDTRWEYTNSKGSVGTEARNIASVSGLTGGITKINAAVTGDSETVIFDRVHATATTASDNRDDINDNVNIDFTLKYDYDEAEVTDGTVTIEGFAAAHQGSGVWRITKTSAAVTTVTYNEFTSSGNAYGITLVDMDGQAGEEVIWDRIEIVSVAFSDSRINIGGSSEVRYVLRYDHDDVQFDSGKGSITGFTWDGVNSWWDKAITGSASVISTNWDESDLAITDSTYGLTAIEDDAGANIITDRVEVYYEAVDDSLVLKNENIEYRIKARLDYDNHELGTGDSVTANSGAMAWDAVNSWFDDQRTQATVGSYLFDVTAASEASYGITALYEPQSSPTGYWKDTPNNDAADSDASFDVDVYGWVNVTVTDEDGVANLATVEVQVTTSGSEVFTLRWTQSSGVFSEQSDASGVCTLDVSGSTRVNVDADTDRIGFRFKVSAGAQMGAVSVQATTTDDDGYSDQDPYSSEFSVNWYGEITIGDGSHSWSSLSPGDSQQTLDTPVDTDIDVTVSSNGAFDLQGKVSAAPTSGAYTIPLSNLLIHEDTVGSAAALTTGYVDIGGLTSQSRGLSLAKSFKLWLTVPNPQQDGSYTYTLSVQITTP